MKKHIKTFLLCSALGISFTGSISAEAADTDFVIKDNVLVSYTGEGGQVTVPNGVETIGEKAFYMNDNITEIILPDSVTTIEEWAFADSGISVIELPDNITTINALTFYNCDKLVSVKLPEQLETIGKYAFDYCSALTEITIPDNVTTIGEGAFRGSGLKKIVFPKSVQYIEQDALSECANLTKVTIKNRKANINNPSNIYQADGGIQTGLGTIFGPTINAGEGIPLTDWSSFRSLTIEGYRYSTAEELATCLNPLDKMLGFKKIQFKALDKKTSVLDKVKVTKSVTLAEKEKSTIKTTLPKGLKRVKKFTKKSGQVKVTYQSSDESIAKVNSKGVVTLCYDRDYDYPLYVYTTLTQPNGNRKVYTTKLIFKSRVALERVKVTPNLTLCNGEKAMVKVTLPKGLAQVTKFTKNSGQVTVIYGSSNNKVMKVNNKGVVTIIGEVDNNEPLYVYTIVRQKDGHDKSFKTKVTIKD